jgi:hypothetical protein
MALEKSPTSEVRDEPLAPADTGAPDVHVESGAGPGPFSLASLLELNDDELAQPLSRAAPAEHRWEQLTLGVAPDTGEALGATLRSGVASQPPSDDRELIPGLQDPGAIEVPVYLAGRALRELSQHEATSAEGPAATVRPPAIAAAKVGPPRIRMEAPTADFAKSGNGPVLWPKRKKSVAAAVLPEECAKCGAPFEGERCAHCDHDVAVSSRSRRTGVWHELVAAFVESDSRLIRTVGALALAPGELTRALLDGRRRRYFSPSHVALATLALFGVISAVGGLRPRPDRVLTIGTERTSELPAGLADATVPNLAVDAPPDLVREVATALDYLPVLWLPLMAFGIVAVVAAVRTFDRRNDSIEMVFTTHFAAWFVIWWGLLVPVVLLLTRFGFEYAATVAGITHVRYLDDGRIDGLSATWNTLRSLAGAPGFHSLLLAVGLLPWAVLAYRRAFDATWLRALLTGVLVTAVPLLLLLPFA